MNWKVRNTHKKKKHLSCSFEAKCRPFALNRTHNFVPLLENPREIQHLLPKEKTSHGFVLPPRFCQLHSFSFIYWNSEK